MFIAYLTLDKTRDSSYYIEQWPYMLLHAFTIFVVVAY